MLKKYNKAIVFIIILAMSLVSVTGCGGGNSGDGSENDAAPKKQYVTFAANPSSSAFYPYWVAVGKAVGETYPEFQITVSESQGAVDIANRIRSGESILGNCVSTTDFQNYNGVGAFEGKPNKDARTLWYYAVSPMIVCVAREGDVESLEDLNGVKYNLGGTGTSGAVVSNDIFNLLGIEVDSFESSQSDAADAYASRQIEGTIKFGSLAGDSYVMRLNAALAVDILSFSDEQIKKITTEFPYLSAITIPGGTYDGIDYDVNTVAFYQGATSTTNLSQEDGYKVVKAVNDDGKKIINAGFPANETADILGMALTSPIPLHSGTVQYMKEMGMEVPDHLIPEEYQE